MHNHNGFVDITERVKSMFHRDTPGDKVKNAAQDAGQAVQSGWDEATSSVNNQYEDLKNKAGDGYDYLKGEAEYQYNSIKNKGNHEYENLKNGADYAYKQGKNEANRIANEGRVGAQYGYHHVKHQANEKVSEGQNYVNDHYERLKDQLEDGKNAAGDIYASATSLGSQATENVGDAWENAKHKASKGVNDALNWKDRATEVAGEYAESASSRVADVTEEASQKAQDYYDQAKNEGEGYYNYVNNYVKLSADDAKKEAARKGENIKDTFNDYYDEAKDKLKDAAGNVKNTAEKYKEQGEEYVNDFVDKGHHAWNQAHDYANEKLDQGAENIVRITQKADDLKNQAASSVDSLKNSIPTITNIPKHGAQDIKSSAQSGWEHAKGHMPHNPIQHATSPVGSIESSYGTAMPNYPQLSTFYASVIAIHFILLSRRTWLNRKRTITFSGDGSAELSKGAAIIEKSEKSNYEPYRPEQPLVELRRSVTNLGHFTSTMPIALILLGFMEMSGYPSVLLHILFATVIGGTMLYTTENPSTRELGAYVSWTGLGIAAFSCGIVGLTGNPWLVSA